VIVHKQTNQKNTKNAKTSPQIRQSKTADSIDSFSDILETNFGASRDQVYGVATKFYRGIDQLEQRDEAAALGAEEERRKRTWRRERSRYKLQTGDACGIRIVCG
jgi:hypothetical protein